LKIEPCQFPFKLGVNHQVASELALLRLTQDKFTCRRVYPELAERPARGTNLPFQALWHWCQWASWFRTSVHPIPLRNVHQPYCMCFIC